MHCTTPREPAVQSVAFHRFLKEVSADRVQAYLIDPHGSQLFNFVKTGELKSLGGSSEIEGIGIGRLTANFKKSARWSIQR